VSMLLQEESHHLQITHLVSLEHSIIYYFSPQTTLNQLVILSFQILKQLILLVDFQTLVIQAIIYQLVLNLKSTRTKYCTASAEFVNFEISWDQVYNEYNHGHEVKGYKQKVSPKSKHCRIFWSMTKIS
jgi:hypothetical protein